ncbi:MULTISPECIES: Qat anti-phage system TatD family nuclease QatD [Pseudomonas]|uniref:Hydrolase TatD n=1 Tax=Pseudomonas putida TaxID=303 RepID=A0A2S3X606_PSEPU|nr:MULTISPECIES: Qat anti-phage system TatD family nuclease QatD [Pseudomonas]MBF8803182.1 TatD family hydrolase [Pseudomonas asiatica]MCE0881305.1 TatD family hydrolase [Pseudomonas putida]MDO1494508.1 TatD family hydrolase [Pseudomonas putida]POG10548.1 hydrolase TatD [Pseudomonas putida]POG16694.1 hydrolase TatD [Pseudomonas putida]
MKPQNKSIPKWVDFHCHLDLYPDHERLIVECDQAEVATLAVTTTPKAWRRNREIAASSRHVRVALGLHPQLVAERESELPLLERLLEETRYVGEVGLDAGPQFYRSFEAQERVFRRVLEACSEQGGKILTVHSVRCVGKVLTHIEKLLPSDRGKVVLHWFTGSPSEARRAVELGCYFSINSQMLASAKHRSLVALLPSNRILTETDGPFVQSEGRPTRPAIDIPKTVRTLALIRGQSSEQTAIQIISNLRDLIRT